MRGPQRGVDDAVVAEKWSALVFRETGVELSEAGHQPVSGGHVVAVRTVHEELAQQVVAVDFGPVADVDG